MAIRGILFDKDGTVIDYWRTWVPINREVALFAAGGDAGLAAELLRRGGHDPATDRITAGTVLAAGSVDDIAEAFAAHLGERAPPQLAAGIEAIFRSRRRPALGADRGRARHHRRAQARGFRIGLATNDSIGRARGLAGAARHPRAFRFHRGLRLGARRQARSAHGARLLQGRRPGPRRGRHGRRCGARPRHGPCGGGGSECRRAVGHQPAGRLRGPGRPDPRQHQRSARAAGVRRAPPDSAPVTGAQPSPPALASSRRWWSASPKAMSIMVSRLK